MFFGLKGQISKLVREDGVCSSTLAEEQQQRDDCREKSDENEIYRSKKFQTGTIHPGHTHSHSHKTAKVKFRVTSSPLKTFGQHMK